MNEASTAEQRTVVLLKHVGGDIKNVIPYSAVLEFFALCCAESIQSE